MNSECENVVQESLRYKIYVYEYKNKSLEVINC